MVNSKTYLPKSKGLKPINVKKEKGGAKNAELFPIVGIGASAGGLEALEQFFKNVPEKSGLAYVVIQHLDPTQKAMLPELLQRITNMKVSQAKDNMPVQPNCIYVIPPNKSMSILKGRLYLFKPLEIRGLRLPVDFFFRSLADDRRERSIGIVLSGMGSDGSSGLCSIKERNGIVMVQEPSTAKFDSMPRNAIDSVLVDIVADPEELPVRLIDFLKHIPIISSPEDLEIKDKSALEKIIILLRTNTGNDFSLYKKNTIYRRIERRMGVHKIDKIASYVNFLQENPIEVEILFKELLIGVTSFFRDKKVWEKLEKNIFPEIIENLPEGTNLRAWVPACSTGEEAYSMAIIFKEALKNFKPYRRISLQIFATDLDNDAIESARKGTFPVNIAGDVSSDLLQQYFSKTDDGYYINSNIREMVIFAQHNLIKHPPFTKIDIISCRNLLIYLDPELQKKILGLFYYSLNTKGIMLLGGSETVGTLNHLFRTEDSKLKIYKRHMDALVNDLFSFPSSFSRSKPETIERNSETTPPPNLQTLAEHILIQQFSPAGLLVNEEGDILYISGRTGKYLEPASGKANLNVFAMLREGIRKEFPVAFNQAIRKRGLIVLRNVKVGTNGSSQSLNVNIQWIEKPEPLKGLLLIVFTDNHEIIEPKSVIKPGKKSVTSVKEVELLKELQNAREEMQNSVEEMQASQEELKSANEELQSSNEELQSTNEELTSSKEEMQSLNEELQTVNAELLAKVEDFSRVDNDMKNLLNSTDIATLFLDKDLNIRRFTNQATKIFKLIKSDIGRLFTDQVSDLIYPEMTEDAEEVLRTLVFLEKQIPGKDGKWFSIRIMPYRTFDDRIDGLVITFINITSLKMAEEKLNETTQIQRLLLNTTTDVILKLSDDMQILEFNSEAENFFGIKFQDVVNKNFLQLLVPESFRIKTEKSLTNMLDDLQDGKIKLQIRTAEGTMILVECTVKIVRNTYKKATGIILIINNKKK